MQHWTRCHNLDGEAGIVCSGGGAAEIVRDVFVAADMVHEDAMSQIGGDAINDGEGAGSVGGGASESSGSDGEACMEEDDTEVGSGEG